MIRTLFIVIIIFYSVILKSQIVVDSSLTPQQLVQNVLLGNGIAVSNINYVGEPIAIGSFNANGTSFGIAEGILITSGSIKNAVGPNQSSSAGLDNNLPGDSDLDAVVGIVTQDASVLTFDFIPSSDTISFNYIFGSDEYPEFVNDMYNDAFAFLLSGPNPNGGNYTNVNLALVPGASIPVSIDNVNAGLNSQYYVDNNNGPDIEYDGYTVPLEAIIPVVACQTYSIKLVIADNGDGSYDSGVFLEKNSFSSSSAGVYAESLTNDSLMQEGCGGATFTFYRTGNTTQSDCISYLIQGTAQNGIDYVDANGDPISDSICFQAGESEVSFTIYPVMDNDYDNNETIEIAIPQIISCDADTVKATIFIKNTEPMAVETSPDVTICSENGQTATVEAVATGGSGPFSYVWHWDNDSTTGSSMVVNPNITTTYTIHVSDTCLNNIVTNTVTVNNVCDVDIPNVITPNNDNINDYFVIKNLEQYNNKQIAIFNRWGNKIFESANYANDWNGEDSNDGVYFYILTIADDKTYHGKVTVIR